VADAIYAQDNQTSLARWYGAALTTGLSVADIREWPERMDAVTAQDVQKVAAKWLDRRRAVTGFLLPKSDNAAA
jgi:zinc protease